MLPRSVTAATALALFCLLGLLDRATAQEALSQGRWLARHPDTELRVLVWNVDRQLLRKNEQFQRVLRSIDADLLILDEMPSDISADMIASALPAERGPWHVLYGSSGGPHQRASIAARRPLRRLPQLDQLPYPAERYESWLSVMKPERRQYGRTTLDGGVAAVGGLIDIDGRTLLVGGVDLWCCGDSVDSLEEQRRQFESGAIRAAIDRALGSNRVDAILVGGDFNTTAGDGPVAIMNRGPTAQTSLSTVDVRHRGGAVSWTWDGRGTPYPSSKMDYLLHSPRLRLLQAQIFDTEDLDAESLQKLQMASGLSRTLSPHRPIVVDLAWRPLQKTTPSPDNP
jgi:endonuclease/exonuclease/phosphatase (EEP) superfamily protein YafD